MRETGAIASVFSVQFPAVLQSGYRSARHGEHSTLSGVQGACGYGQRGNNRRIRTPERQFAGVRTQAHTRGVGAVVAVKCGEPHIKLRIASRCRCSKLPCRRFIGGIGNMGAEQFPPEFDLSGITQSVQCSGAAHYRITGCINIFIKVKRRFRDNIGVWCQPGGYSGISQHSGGGNRERQENGPPVPAEKRGRWRRQWWWRLFAFQILDIAVEHRVEQLLLFITAGEQRGEPRFELGRVVE